MKKGLRKLFALLAIGTIAFSSFSCVILSDGKVLPPGQAKKVTGDQSAKDHAPGQNK